MGAGAGPAAVAGEPPGGGFQRAVPLPARPEPDGGALGSGGDLCPPGIYPGDHPLICGSAGGAGYSPARGGTLYGSVP